MSTTSPVYPLKADIGADTDFAAWIQERTLRVVQLLRDATAISYPSEQVVKAAASEVRRLETRRFLITSLL